MNKIEYSAIIQSIDKKGNGVYKVYIPELAPDLNKAKTYPAKNRITPFSTWIDPETKGVQSIGCYIPLNVGMKVRIKFTSQSRKFCDIIGLDYDSPIMDSDYSYIFGKTKNGTIIYSDDNKQITGISHNNGETAIHMDNDKISLSVNQVSSVGNNNKGNIQITKTGIFLKFGENGIILNESGIQLVVDNTKVSLTPQMFGVQSEHITTTSDKMEVSSQNTYINGAETLNLKGNSTKISGNQNLSLTGNVINIYSMTNTSLKSNNHVEISGKVSTFIESINIGLTAIGNFWANGATCTLNSPLLTLSGATTAINGGTIFMDSQLLRGTGGAASIAQSLNATTTALTATIKSSNIALATSMHISDPFSGSLCASLTSGLPGSADSPGEFIKITQKLPDDKFISNLIKFGQPNYGATTNIFASLKGQPLTKVI